MTFFKKLTAFGLAAALLFATACSGDSKTTSASGSSSQVSSQDTSSSASSIPQIEGPSGVEITPEVEKETIWGGKAAEKITLGGGTEDYPYIIQTPSELAYAISSGGNGAYYKLDCDIYLNDVSSDKWYEKSGLNEWYDREFKGHIDGDGHCIYGLYFSPEKAPKYAGLICQMVAGSIKNLGIRKSRIFAKAYSGAFAGIANGGEQKVFESCFVDETVLSMYIQTGTNGAGGILGYAASGEGTLQQPNIVIKNCYSKAKLGGYDQDYRLNGIIGTAWDNAYTMENCYSVGYPAISGNGTRAVSTLIDKGAKPEQVYKNIYNTIRDGKGFERMVKVDASKLNGATAKSSLKGFDFTNTWETVSGGTPKLKIFKNIDGKNIKTPDAPSVQVVNKFFEAGSGTKSDPYIVSNYKQLLNVLEGSNADTYYKMSKDIYVNDVTKTNWKTKNPVVWPTNKVFRGNFDGDGYSVYGLYLKEAPAEGDIVNGSAGLFPTLATTAVVRNVNVKSSYISGKAYVGGIAGTVQGSSTKEEYALITGCTVDESVSLVGQTVGGIVGGGHGGAAIAYCGFAGEINFTGGSYRGNGIVGDIWSKNYKVAQSFTVGYAVYRGSFLPKVADVVYSTEEQNGILLMKDSNVYGTAAKTAMPQLDWSIWKTVNDHIPYAKVTPDKDYKF